MGGKGIRALDKTGANTGCRGSMRAQPMNDVLIRRRRIDIATNGAQDTLVVRKFEKMRIRQVYRVLLGIAQSVNGTF